MPIALPRPHLPRLAVGRRTTPARRTGAVVAVVAALGGTATTVVAAPGATTTAVAAAMSTTTPAASSPSTRCPTATRRVHDARELEAALRAARPGSVVVLAPGTYRGRFRVTADGTATRPIRLCGPASAVLDGGRTSHGYTLYLDGARQWRLTGFTVRHGQKGVVADRAVSNVLSRLRVERTGDEAIHLRRASTGNVVQHTVVRNTGLHEARFGEGIYIGSARSNWCRYTHCRPDRSDHNVIQHNDIAATSAESVDIKEGTTGGILRGNVFDGRGMRRADSWVDVKGNGWRISGNRGRHAPLDGFQTHQIVAGWSRGNVFSGNRAVVGARGYGYHLTRPLTNRLRCDNTAIGARRGLSNVRCVR